MNKMRLFVYNGIILTVCALMIRASGVAFSSFIASKTGAEGMGLYQLVLSVYSPALTLAVSGVSLCSSRLVSEELSKRRGGRWKRALTGCLICALAFSLPISAVLFLSAPFICRNWLGNGDAAFLLRMLSVSLPFIALSSCLNGFFTALRRASKSAILQLSEQGVRIGLTVLLILLTRENGIMCLGAVVMGSVCADIFSFALASLLCGGAMRRMTESRVGGGDIAVRILGIALPVSVSSFLRSSLIAIEHMIIPKCLKKRGSSYVEAMASYGTLTGMAMPVILFPASFLYSFSALTVPELAEARAQSDHGTIRLRIRQLFTAFAVFSVGVSAFILFNHLAISQAIYGSDDAAIFIAVLSPLIPFMYLDTAVDSMLKGLGEQTYTVAINVLDATVSVLAVGYLVPRMGIMGYVAVILISELINFTFSIARLKAVTGVRLGGRALLPKICVGAVVGITVCRALRGAVGDGAMALILSGICFSASYVITLTLLGAIRIRMPRRRSRS